MDLVSLTDEQFTLPHIIVIFYSVCTFIFLAFKNHQPVLLALPHVNILYFVYISHALVHHQPV